MNGGYTVKKITELVRPAPDGGVERYYRHQITTAGGTTLTVDIPERQFTPLEVSKTLKAKADNADKILLGKE